MFGGEWLQPDLAALKAAKNAEAKAACDAVLEPLGAEYGRWETATWDQQVTEATALMSDPSTSVPMLAAMAAAREFGSLLPPRHILNAPTKLMKGEGYGAGYRYDHDEPDAFSGQDYFPEKMGRRSFYQPVERGFEREIRKRLDYWSRLRRERGGA